MNRRLLKILSSSALLGVLLFFCVRQNAQLEKYNTDCTYSPEEEVFPDYLYCFREAFPFLRLTTDIPPFGTRVVNGHREKHTLRGIEWEGEEASIPIILVTFDRITVLVETIRSFHRCIRTPFEIIIHDEGSTFPAVVFFLRMLERNGVRVFRASNVRKKQEMLSEYPLGFIVGRISRTVARVLQLSNASEYVVSDPDCALDGAPGHVLKVYQKALAFMPSVKGVGAAVRSDDVSKRCVMLDPDWDKPKEVRYFFYNEHQIRYTVGPVDTTFCMYRRNFTFDRMQGSIRLGMPFAIRHLDFYFENLANAPPDVIAYLSKNKMGISHASEYIK